MSNRPRITDRMREKLLGDLTLKACELFPVNQERSEFITYMQAKINRFIDAEIKKTRKS